MSEKRRSLTANGNVLYQLKTPYRDGTTHVFEPPDFIARLVALVPEPRVNLSRFPGVFAPNSAHRARVTPAKRGTGNEAKAVDEGQLEPLDSQRRLSAYTDPRSVSDGYLTGRSWPILAYRTAT